MNETQRALAQTLRVQRKYGKYRGFVTDNADPELRGRVRVQVPALLRPIAGWSVAVRAASHARHRRD